MRIIAGEARGKKLLSTRDRSVRPPLEKIREAVFQLLRGEIEGRTALDLFAGTGSLGLEAISRGARRAIFVDNSTASLAILRKNILRTGFTSRCEVIRGDGFSSPDLAATDEGTLGVVFLDPPFGLFDDEAIAVRLFSRVGEILTSLALHPGASVIIRTPRKYEKAIPFSASEIRLYGESVVIRFVKDLDARDDIGSRCPCRR